MYSNDSAIKTLLLTICFVIIIGCSMSSPCQMTVGLPDHRCCGRDRSLYRIGLIGGENTSLIEYPWLALLEYPPHAEYLCGGSLITGRLVLTAAHCTCDPTPVAVRLGEYDLKNKGPDCIDTIDHKRQCTDGEITIKIAFIHIHPRFHENKGTQKLYDIAIIELAQTAPFTDFISPICLPLSDVTSDSPTNLIFYAAGWGTMHQEEDGSKLSGYANILSCVKQHITLPYVPLEECNEDNLDASQICAGGEEGKDSCYGDSGGPLMYKRNAMIFETVGIVSYGENLCAQKDKHGVYTKVFAYKDFILQVVNKAVVRARNEEIRINVRNRFFRNYCAGKDCN